MRSSRTWYTNRGFAKWLRHGTLTELSTLVKKNHDGILDNETVQQIEGEIKSLNEGLARLIPQRMDVVYQNMTLLDIAKMEFHYETDYGKVSEANVVSFELYQTEDVLVASIPLGLTEFKKLEKLTLTQNGDFIELKVVYKTNLDFRFKSQSMRERLARKQEAEEAAEDTVGSMKKLMSDLLDALACIKPKMADA